MQAQKNKFLQIKCLICQKLRQFMIRFLRKQTEKRDLLLPLKQFLQHIPAKRIIKFAGKIPHKQVFSRQSLLSASLATLCMGSLRSTQAAPAMSSVFVFRFSASTTGVITNIRSDCFSFSLFPRNRPVRQILKQSFFFYPHTPYAEVSDIHISRCFFRFFPSQVIKIVFHTTAYAGEKSCMTLSRSSSMLSISLISPRSLAEFLVLRNTMRYACAFHAPQYIPLYTSPADPHA